MCYVFLFVSLYFFFCLNLIRLTFHMGKSCANSTSFHQLMSFQLPRNALPFLLGPGKMPFTWAYNFNVRLMWLQQKPRLIQIQWVEQLGQKSHFTWATRPRSIIRVRLMWQAKPHQIQIRRAAEINWVRRWTLMTWHDNFAFKPQKGPAFASAKSSSSGM